MDSEKSSYGINLFSWRTHAEWTARKVIFGSTDTNLQFYQNLNRQ